MKPLHALIALMVLACCLAVPVLAQNSYSGVEVWQENAALMKEKYVMPALDQNEIDSFTSGHLFISLRTPAGCIPEIGRRVSVVPYDNAPVIPVVLGLNGRYDLRLPAIPAPECTTYDVVLPFGTGSDPNQPNTWKQETATVKICPGQRTEVSFIGAGQACGGAEEPVIKTAPECHDEYRVRGHWNYFYDFFHHHWHHYWDHSSHWSPWSDEKYDFWSEIPSGDKQVREVCTPLG